MYLIVLFSAHDNIGFKCESVMRPKKFVLQQNDL